MLPLLGLLVSIAGMWFLIVSTRSRERISNAVWVPFFWLLIAFSRPISSWLAFSGPPNGVDEYVDGSPLDRNVLTLLVAASFYILFRRRHQIFAIIRANPALVAYFAFCLLSIFWADYQFVLFKRWIRSVGDVGMMAIIMTEANPMPALNWVLTRIAIILLPLSIVFIRFYPSLGRAYSYGGVPMWTGVATDKNAQGALCMLLGVALVWWGLSERKSREKGAKQRLLAIYVLLGMVIYLLTVANSQTALMCFVLGSALVVMTAVRSLRARGIVGATVIGMVGACFCVLFLGLGSGALTALGRNSTLTGRTDVWEVVLPFAKNPLLGAGYENFWIGERLKTIERALNSALNQAHNGYIEIYLNIGWVGLILLGALVFTGYKNIMTDIRRDPDPARLRLVFFLICLIYNFTEASFKMMAPVWLLFLWAVMRVPPVVQRRVSVISATGLDQQAVPQYTFWRP